MKSVKSVQKNPWITFFLSSRFRCDLTVFPFCCSVWSAFFFSPRFPRRIFFDESFSISSSRDDLAGLERCVGSSCRIRHCSSGKNLSQLRMFHNSFFQLTRLPLTLKANQVDKFSKIRAQECGAIIQKLTSENCKNVTTNNDKIRFTKTLTHCSMQRAFKQAPTRHC